MAKIALCAGHKQSAKGAVNKKYSLNEFDEASVVVGVLFDLLKALGHTPVVVGGGLRRKVNTINAGSFDMAVDVHFNADFDRLDPEDRDDTRGHGCMVMYCPHGSYGQQDSLAYIRRGEAAEMSYRMSEYIGLEDLGARQGWYWGNNPPEQADYFLRKTNCPAFIPEIGYIDNNGFCEEWLLSNKHSYLAEAMAAGILASLA